jgi:hypothetical protein
MISVDIISEIMTYAIDTSVVYSTNANKEDLYQIYGNRLPRNTLINRYRHNDFKYNKLDKIWI